MNHPTRFFIVGAALALCGVPGLKAQTFTWLNRMPTTPNPAWGVAANWSAAGGTPPPNSNTAVAQFGNANSAAVDPTIGNPFTVQQVFFNANAYDYSITGVGVLTIDENTTSSTANAIVVNKGTQSFGVNTNLVFANTAVGGTSDDQINIGGGGVALNLRGSVSIQAAGGLKINGLGGPVNFYGTVSSGTGGGTLSVGNGIAYLRKNMTYSAGTALDVFNGTLNLEVGTVATGSTGGVEADTKFSLGKGGTQNSALMLTASGLTISNSIDIGDNLAGNTATVNRTVGVSAGTNGIGAFSGALDLAAVQSAGTNGTKNITFSAATSNTATFSGQIITTKSQASPSSLFIDGGGTVILSNPSTTAANTILVSSTVVVQNGTTLLADTAAGMSATGAAPVNVLATGILGGTSLVSGKVTVAANGTLRGGNGGSTTDTLTLGGDLTLSAGSTIALTLGTGGAHSTLARTGTGSFTFDSAQSFSLSNIQNGTYLGIITGLSVDPNVSGWTVNDPNYMATFSYSSATGNVDLVLATPNTTNVPEPSTIAAGALGLAALAWSQRRRSRRPLAA